MIQTRPNAVPLRPIVTLLGTMLALVLLLSFRTPDQAPQSNLALAPISANPTRPGSIPTSRPPASTRSSSGATPRPSAGASASAGAAAGGATRTIDGPVIATQFGDVQVEITVAGGTITDVEALQLPSDRRRSQSINNYAGPILRTEALQAQSAQIDQVSGATYTSEAYVQSLQGAIDQAHG